ncbi:phage tail protein [Gilliamella sp. BG2]|uniref:phage tail protein n=1 Tax=Gilliamella sp. BG2 TaxID=3351509 RepID=UPI003985B287
MHRIDTSTAQRDKFGQGKNGFTRGNPQTGTPATQLDYLYCDAIQEEIANAIESAGIKLDKSKHDQLATAIKEFVKKGSVKLNSSTNSTSETEAATPLAVKKVNDQAVTAYDRANIANANAISANSNANNAHRNIENLGGRISNIEHKFVPTTTESRVYSNDKKTYLLVRDDGIVAAYNTDKNQMVWGFDAKGELGVGTIHSSHILGLSEHVTNMFNQSFGQHGYTKMPNGLITQWGIANSLGADGKNGTLQSFFIAFPNACFSVVTSDVGNGVNPTAAAPVSNSQFRCWGKTPINGAPYSNTSMFYIAIGF